MDAHNGAMKAHPEAVEAHRGALEGIIQNDYGTEEEKCPNLAILGPQY
jgi:hypothetical protein